MGAGVVTEVDVLKVRMYESAVTEPMHVHQML